MKTYFAWGLAALLAAVNSVDAQQNTTAASSRDRYWTASRVEFNVHAGPVRNIASPTAARASGNRKELSIANSKLRLHWDPQTERITIISRRGEHKVLTNLSFNTPVAIAMVTSVSDPFFGKGQGMEFLHGDGSRDSASLYEDLPFAVFRSTLRNDQKEPVVIQSVRPLRGEVNLGKPVAQLKTLGTGGLSEPGKDPGSYEWFVVAEPQSRNGVVFGMLTHDRCSGVVFSRVSGDAVQVGLQLDYGRLRIAPGASAELDQWVIGYFDDARMGLEAWADAIAKIYSIKLPEAPVGYCTWYSNPHGGASDEIHLAEQATFAERELAPFGFSLIQIDDKWQAGLDRGGSPKKNFTTHDPKGPYPSGMKAAADMVRSHGLIPGIWFMPFAGTFQDPFFAAHPEWFVKTPAGKPYDTSWGGTSLDMTHPGAREHLRGVASRIGRDWGFDYIKIDGLWTGTATSQLYVNSGFKDDDLGEASFHDPNKSNVEAYRDGLKLVRESVGPKVFILGCNGPQNMRSYGGAFGLLDGMRVGPDNEADWGGLTEGPLFGTRHYFLHRRVWYNDPDPVYARASMPINHSQLICSWVAISDQLNLNSEWLPGLPPERLDILKRTMPYHHRIARPVDYFEENLPRIWVISDTNATPRRDVVGLFNWNKDEFRFDYPVERMGLEPQTEYAAFDFWGNKSLPTIRNRLQATVPGQSCLVLALRAQQPHPQLVSTSRHVTQGMIDVTSERWDNSTKSLTGWSKVVGGDPYELRIVGNLKAKGIEISDQEKSAGVTAAIEEDRKIVRAKITSPANREVSWTVRFEQAQ